MPTDLPARSDTISDRPAPHGVSDRVIEWIATALSVALLGIGLCASVIGFGFLAFD